MLKSVPVRVAAWLLLVPLLLIVGTFGGDAFAQSSGQASCENNGCRTVRGKPNFDICWDEEGSSCDATETCVLWWCGIPSCNDAPCTM